MNHQFKPGDPALTLISLGHFPAGTVVSLVELIEKGDIVRDEKSGKPFVANGRGWICERDGHTLAIGEKNLMPLRGDFIPEQPKRQEVLDGIQG